MRTVLLALALWAGTGQAWAAADRTITIQDVLLKSASGEWISVIRPDKLVDLSTTEPAVSFFNNGRVPPGAYVNFRLVLDKAELTTADFASPLVIKKGSFVGVRFHFALDPWPPERVEEVTIIIDERTVGIPGDAVDLKRR